VTFTGCVFDGNSVVTWGGAIYCGLSPVASFTDCVFSSNSAASGGGALYAANSDLTLIGCTIFGNTGPIGAGMTVGYMESPVELSRCVIAFNSPGEGMKCASSPSPIVDCTDVYGNVGGDWVGCLAGLEAVNGNLSLDPVFCDAAGGDFSLDGTSPCLPGNHPDGSTCGLMGAKGYGCGSTTATEPVAWGDVKRMFR